MVLTISKAHKSAKQCFALNLIIKLVYERVRFSGGDGKYQLKNNINAFLNLCVFFGQKCP